MVNYRSGNETWNLDAVFSALAHPARRAILARLAGRARRVTDLAEPFQMSLPAVSKHLRVLEQAGLIGRTVRGRVHTCRLEAAAMKTAAGWIETYRHFWEGRLDSLAEYLRGVEAGTGQEVAAGNGPAPAGKDNDPPEKN